MAKAVKKKEEYKKILLEIEIELDSQASLTFCYLPNNFPDSPGPSACLSINIDLCNDHNRNIKTIAMVRWKEK